MAPIRVAIIGLSASAKTSWAAQGHLPYLLSERGQAKYQIVALCNSSAEAAQNAIKHFELPPNVKAYGSPTDLAADPDIDLVVCNTRVDVHYDTIKPSIEAGKDIYVEWPVAENLARATEIAGLARKHNVRVVVGIQARLSPVVLKVQELLAAGAIGKVLSSTVHGYSSLLPRDSLPEGLAYFAERAVGGNPLTIAYGHMIDFVHSTLGEFVDKSMQSHLQLQRPQVRIMGGSLYGGLDPNAVLKTVTSDVPDLISVHGTLTPSSTVAPGASLVVSYRSGPPFPGTPGMLWLINGEHGEIRVTSPAGSYLQADSYGLPIDIEVQDYRVAADDPSKGVRKEEWVWSDEQKPLFLRGRQVGEVYELFAKGEEQELMGIDVAIRRHRELDEMLKGFTG